jgi:2-methylcitrate dehydratase
MDVVLDSIAEFATGLTYDDIPDAVKNAAKERVLDSIGCAIGAGASAGASFGDCDTAKIGRTLAGPAALPETAGRIIGSRDECAADGAAFVNSCMIRYLDFNDTYPGGHPSDSMGGLFAIAPVFGASG